MKVLIVYNPFSRNNKIEKYKDYLINKLKNKYDIVDFYKSEGIRTITNYVYNNVNNYDALIISGGDGTINEAITGVVEASSNVLVSIIPSGTVNDLATLLGYSKNVKKSVKKFLTNTNSYMDICKINDKYFSYAAAAGKYTDVSYTTPRFLKRLFGPLAYLFYGIKEFFKYEKLDLEITYDNNKIEGTFYVIFLLNTKRIAGFIFDRKHDVILNDGKIEIALINKCKITWPRLARFFICGNKAKKGIKLLSASNIQIKSLKEIDINTDGEFACSAKEINIRVLKEKVNFSISSKIKNKYFFYTRELEKQI